MPVKEKEIELDDGTKIRVKQASGRTKLKIEAIQARIFRKFRDNGNPSEWTMEQHEAFADALDEAGGGIEAQVEAWLPNCVIEPENFDYDSLTTPELMLVLGWIRGDEEAGALPWEHSQE